MRAGRVVPVTPGAAHLDRSGAVCEVLGWEVGADADGSAFPDVEGMVLGLHLRDWQATERVEEPRRRGRDAEQRDRGGGRHRPPGRARGRGTPRRAPGAVLWGGCSGTYAAPTATSGRRDGDSVRPLDGEGRLVRGAFGLPGSRETAFPVDASTVG